LTKAEVVKEGRGGQSDEKDKKKIVEKKSVTDKSVKESVKKLIK
jgi:hypothetical protein